jgi:peptidoglycan-associated lipoprotein
VGGLAIMVAGCAGNHAMAPAASSSPSATSAGFDQASRPAVDETSKAANGRAKSNASGDSAETAAEVRAPNSDAPSAAGPTRQTGAGVSLKAVDAASGRSVNLDFETIYFDYDKYNIRPQDVPAIKHNAMLLQGSPTLHVVIEGNCDERGTTEYNLALGQRRAVAVYQALTAASVAKDRMKTVSFGKEKPLDSGHTDQAWAKNRRSNFRAS